MQPAEGGPPALATLIRTQLSGAGDGDRAAKQRKYMKSALPFHGLPVPEVRRVTRHSLRIHPVVGREQLNDVVLELFDHATHREEWNAALEILARTNQPEYRTPEQLPLYLHLIERGAWWDIVDDVASHLVGSLLLRDEQTHRALSPTIGRWAREDSLWVRRAAVICQLRARKGTDLALLDAVIAPNLRRPEFFLRKAIGWALRECAKSYPGWVQGYLDRNRDELSPLSYREASKHLAVRTQVGSPSEVTDE